MTARDDFERYYAEKIWALVPEIYKTEDGLQPTPGVLRAIVEVIAQQAAVTRRSIDRLWEDQHVETSDEWAVPYIGDLVGTRILPEIDARARRVDVARTSVRDAHAGAVCAVQRTDGALRLNVHLHVLALDGVYVRDVAGGKLEFHALGAPTRRDVEEVAHRTADRVEKILRRAGRSLAPEMQSDEPASQLELDESGLAACYAAAARGVSVSGERAGLPALRLV